jgi:hypothetical protein
MTRPPTQDERDYRKHEVTVAEAYRALPVDWRDRVRGFAGLAYRFSKLRRAKAIVAAGVKPLSPSAGQSSTSHPSPLQDQPSETRDQT